MNNREKDKQEMIYGIHPLMEAVDAGKEIEKVLIQKGLRSDGFKELMALLKELSVPVQFVPREKLNRLSRKNHQGVIAFISPVSFYKIEDVLPMIFEKGENPFFLILDKLTDVRNFGAILRTAESAGVHAVLIPTRNTAQLNSGTVKSSAGAIYKIPICRSENLKVSINYLKGSGVKVCAATEKADKSVYDAQLSGPLAIIMGSEGEGVSPEYLKQCDEKFAIPMLGEIGSLNVSVASGVVLYEAVRQKIIAG
ncbi:MAG: 23S rRNA (guanosine(2251)-2'-O)-methyltransferase RlmB [Marinilabiliales bacterium]|nr:MAG: 23S rRNA (guanosine(2251)-2'-O)-methyltransferase RlmB [Marinilabiliales bacterium]